MIRFQWVGPIRVASITSRAIITILGMHRQHQTKWSLDGNSHLINARVAASSFLFLSRVRNLYFSSFGSDRRKTKNIPPASTWWLSSFWFFRLKKLSMNNVFSINFYQSDLYQKYSILRIHDYLPYSQPVMYPTVYYIKGVTKEIIIITLYQWGYTGMNIYIFC